MTITIIGHGYVGLVSACVFADLGNLVYVIGRDKEKINRLKNGDPIIFEPGLKELLQKNLDQKRINFTTSYDPTIKKSDIVIIAVGTPTKTNGESDLTSVMAVAKEIAKYLKSGYTIVCCKSTVPVGTNQKIKKLIESKMNSDCQIDIASLPEFLREGSGINDTFFPDRIVIGSDSQKAKKLLLKLHRPLGGSRVVVSLESAEMIKYASNSLLATKISFANLISFICENSGANIAEVMAGVGLDKRIGKEFLDAGIGYGGSCFPKDVKALITTGRNFNTDMSLLEAVEKINYQARSNFLTKIIKQNKPGKVAIWGLAFKPNTDDIRDAPSIYIIDHLLQTGNQITVYDPEAAINIKKIYNNRLNYASNPYKATENADYLIILTEWNEFKQIDLNVIKQKLAKPVIFDGRNIYDPKQMEQLGFEYISVGR